MGWGRNGQSHHHQCHWGKEHHYSKETIEEACLEEARAQFTQTNNTAFMTEPLLSELGLLGTRQESFDQIAQGTYELPQGSPDNAIQLIPLLQ